MTILVPELESIANGPRASQPWSEKESQIVEEYYPRGVSAAKLAAYLSSQGTKRSVSSVEHFIKRRGLCGRR